MPPVPRSTPRGAATLEEARALAHPLRLRIIRLTFDSSLTNKELADRLGRDPASTLHHVRTLLATGFLEAQAPRRGARGSREVPYRSTGKSWILDVGDHVSQGAASVDAFRAELLESPPGDLGMARLALRLNPAQHVELRGRLFAIVEEAASWDPVPDGEPWALFVAIHRRAE